MSGRGLCLVLGLVLASLLALGFGLMAGSEGLEVRKLISGAVDPLILWQIRWPRSLGAYLAGALLALGGALAQGVFRNPLADPYVLGSASGAGCAVAIYLLLIGGGFTQVGVSGLLLLGLNGAAFIGALFAVLIGLVLARGAGDRLRLILAGVVVSMVLSAVTALLTYRSPELLATLQSFMLGSSAFVDLRGCAMMFAVWLCSMALSLASAKALSALSLGEATAISLGVSVSGLRAGLIGTLALATGAAVAQCGLIAFVGLIGPHLARSAATWARSGARLTLFTASASGGVLLALADGAARTLRAPEEIPLGVVTALVGGVFLLMLLYQRGDAQLGGAER